LNIPAGRYKKVIKKYIMHQVMVSVAKYLVNFIIMLLIFSNVSGQQFSWKRTVPENEGFSTEKLNALRDTLALHNTTSILVIRNDKIVLEWYAPGWNENKLHYTASLAKALVGGMSLGLALDDGRLQVDDPAFKYIPEWKDDFQKSKITIRQLATHSSGIEDAELSARDIAEYKALGIEIKDRHMDIPGWKGAFWRKDPDPFSVSRDYAPVISAPGSEYHYSNPAMAMLAYVVTSSYKGSAYKDIRTLLRERIMKPIGINEDEWQIGYGQTYNIDGLELVANWGGGSFTPRAVARIGRLMLNRGNWDGKQLIDPEWAEQVVKYAGTPLPPRDEKDLAPACGLAWYNNFDGVWVEAPRDLFSGAGAGNQTLIVIPCMNIIIVRNGENMFDPLKSEGFNYGIVNYLVNPLMEAFNEPPYPISNTIREIKFAPESSIIRKASGSDNWPITWGDDDNQYAAYGDGWGFEPKVDKKLSLGLARITGNPDDFQGVNIRSETGEFTGQGRFGKKASGLLMIDGVLYMWIRNANENGQESQLGWSSDHGKTWRYTDWKFKSGFGYPTFLNFGKNYEGAMDNYVYIYSHNETDAYKPADHMVLARVPMKKITDQKSYEFFVTLDNNGNPVWSKDIDKRGAVFTNPAMCYRNAISYNAGLKRYLWCQVLPASKHPQGSRFQGGFGIYEAAEPWGPWYTVFYTKEWDVGPGETSSFPTKWMSKDGKTCCLLFSGDDCFSIRKVEFITE
jgi:CubicO group peptidase (beta-lactamase class C family)